MSAVDYLIRNLNLSVTDYENFSLLLLHLSESPLPHSSCYQVQVTTAPTQVNKLRDKVLGQGITTLIRNSSNQKDGRLVY